MRFQLFDIDVKSPVQTLGNYDADGIGVLIRYEGRPIDFWMESVESEDTFSEAYLATRIIERSSQAITDAALRRSLPLAETGRPVAPDASSVPVSAERSVTIAICTKDRSTLLDRTLASLDTHLNSVAVGELSSQGLQVDVLVVDNNSVDDQTRTVVAKHKGVRYTFEPLAGLDFARNRVVAESTGQLLVYLDDDAVVDVGWLPGLIRAWNANPDAGGFTGQVLPLELETEAQILFEQNGGFRRGFHRIRFDPSLQSNPLFPGGAGVFGTGTNMAFRRDLIESLGGFDEALDTGAPLPGGGDHDMFYRVIRSGHAMVYEPEYLVFHEHRRDMKALKRQFYSWGTGVMAFLTKCYQTDRAARKNLRAVTRWWFKEQLRQVRRSLRKRHPLPFSMVVAELWGGIIGIAGEYNRSKKRSAEIRRAE